MPPFTATAEPAPTESPTLLVERLIVALCARRSVGNALDLAAVSSTVDQLQEALRLLRAEMRREGRL